VTEQSRDMMMKCKSMTNSYAKYIQFFRTFDARDGMGGGRLMTTT